MATEELNKSRRRNRRERSERSIPIWIILLGLVFLILVFLICGLIFLSTSSPPTVVTPLATQEANTVTNTPMDNRETAIAQTAQARMTEIAATNMALTDIAVSTDFWLTEDANSEFPTEAATEDANSAFPTETATEGANSEFPTLESTQIANVSTATQACFIQTDWFLYRVVAGDTLSSLANRTNSTVSALQQGNCKSSRTITVGEQLRLPQLPLATLTARPSNTAVVSAPIVMIDANGIAIYDSTFDRDTVLLLADSGSEFAIVGLDESRRWLLVALPNGQMGRLLLNSNVEINANLEDLPIVELPTSSASTATSEPSATATPIDIVPTEEALPTESPEPVAAVDAIGNASIYPRYNTELEYPETMSVILELIFDEWFITPTPRGEVTVVSAVQPNVTRPAVIVEASNNPKPPPARAEDKLNDIPPYVIAELDCLDSSFTGCSEQALTQLQLQGTNSWEWTIQPIEGVSGNQNLTLRLYAAQADGTKRDTTPIWTHNFIVAVQFSSGTENNNLLPLLTMLMIIIALLLLAFFLIRAFLKRRIIATVFISYRRKGGLASARNLHENLTKRHIDTFFDFEDLHHGRFGDNLKREIEERDNFILVLAPDTFESEWVIKEAEYALEHNKNIIPVTIDGFDIGTADFPESIEVIRDFNAVDLSPQYYEASIDKIVSFLLAKGRKENKSAQKNN